MEKTLFDAFSNLSINDKRDKISDELMLIGSLLEHAERNFGLNNTINIKNYNKSKDENINESEMLNFLYQDIYNIQKEIITITKLINKTYDL